MKLTTRKGRPACWGVHYKDHATGKYVRRYFRTQQERKDFIATLQLGTHEGFNALEWQRWMQIREWCERAGYKPEDVVLAGLRNVKPQTGKRLEEAFYEYMKDKSRQRIDVHTQERIDQVITRFIEAHGKRTHLHELTREQIQRWFDNLRYKPYTLRNYKITLHGFFRWAKQRQYLSEPPTEHIILPKIKSSEPSIMGIEQVERLFEANKDADPQTCAFMALGFFAGLRTSSIERLAPQDVKLQERVIILPAEKFKTGRRHVIDADMIPETLWHWLERIDQSTYGIKKNTFTTRRNRALARAGLAPSDLPHNGMRHSFASYHCALEGSAGKTALALGHVGEALLWKHYRGIASKQDAVRYFGLEPSKLNAE